MESSITTPSTPSVQMPLMLVAEVQDSLLVVVHDLTRLDGLLAHAMENLMERFTSASANLAGVGGQQSIGRRPQHPARCGNRVAVSGYGFATDNPHLQDSSGLCLPSRQ
jgi:hypothetical protein